MRLPSKRTLQIIRKVLIFLFTLNFTYMFVRHGYFKFDPEGFWSSAFEKWSYPVWFMFFIGLVEFLGGLIILIPRIAGYGAISLAVVMFGALITRLIHGVSTGDAIAITFNMVAMLILAFEYNPFKEWLTTSNTNSID